MADIVHRPEGDDVMGRTAVCGETASTAPNRTMTMHVFDYNCPECKRLSGEKG